MSGLVSGEYVARAVKGLEFLESGKKGTPFVRIHFEIEGGQFEGEKTHKDCYLTEATTDRTIETLILCGCTYEGSQELDNEAGLGDNQVRLVLAEEQYEGKTFLKVQWVNDINGAPGGAPGKPFTPKGFGARIKALTHGKVVKETKPSGKSEPWEKPAKVAK